MNLLVPIGAAGVLGLVAYQVVKNMGSSDGAANVKVDHGPSDDSSSSDSSDDSSDSSDSTPAPQPSPPPVPVPVYGAPAPSGTVATIEEDTAKTLAQSVADDINSQTDFSTKNAADLAAGRGEGYDREQIKTFQKAARFETIYPNDPDKGVDGWWGRRTRGAVEYFIGPLSGLPRWADVTAETFPPPGVSVGYGSGPGWSIAGADPSQADLAREIKSLAPGMHQRKLTAIFQRGEGLVVNGLLDSPTRSALSRYV